MFDKPFVFFSALLTPLAHHCICICCKGAGGVYQWGTGLLSQAKRALNPQPVPAHLSSKEPCLVTGRLYHQKGVYGYRDFTGNTKSYT